MNFDIKHLSRIPLLLAFLICTSAFAQPGNYYPPPSSVIFHNDTLTIFPPDSLPGDPVVLVAYNIFVDSVFFDNVTVTNPAEPVDFIPDMDLILPGDRSFCAKAVYNEWISESTCDTTQVFYGMELPVLEDWSSGSFETLQWTTGSENWIIDVDEGNPSPSAAFFGNPEVTGYEIALESYPMIAVGMSNGKIWLDFDIKLYANQATGTEKLMVQVWNWMTQTWTTRASYDNSDGSFELFEEHINIKSNSMDKVFMIRFLATGENSMEIQSWHIDNIHIYRRCYGIDYVNLEEHIDYNWLEWSGYGGGFDWWFHWDDGVFSGTSIGTGDAAEFDFAARWTSAQIADLQGTVITEVAFVPAEWNAAYRIRIWTGSGPDTLIVDQPVEYPVIGQWTYQTLNNPVTIDVTKDLWVGYYVNAQTGYPGGVDDGPAIDGFGNMVYFQDNWSTLKEINPDLDYNWNIALHVGPEPPDEDLWLYNIYRKADDGDYHLLDTTRKWQYTDSSIILEEKYCYKVSVVWLENSDTCESYLSDEECETLCLGVESTEREISVKIYPNPAVNHLIIESQDEIREIRLYNSLGEPVKKLEIGNSKFGLDCSGLVEGIYFIQITTYNNIYRQKIIMLGE